MNEREVAREKIIAGADSLDVVSRRLSIAKTKNAIDDARERLADAQEKRDDYTIHAPFDGILSSFDGKIGDNVSPSTILASHITQEVRVEIALNEVDVTWVEAGKKLR